MIKRHIYSVLLSRLREERRFIQVLAGPRQVGKTTLARQAMEDLSLPMHYASADEPGLNSRTWIGQQWEVARLRAAQQGAEALLVLDEIQKITDWSGVVKQLWDEDTVKGVPVKLLLLGSAPLLIQKGLTESLAGRFELIPATHWSFSEMHAAFGWTPEQFIYFGGYPGAAPLIGDRQRWGRYINDSLIETTISRDILLMTRVDKPALLRRLFHLGCAYSGQILSYQKMLGQLHDAGNTTTLAHYLELLAGAGMIAGIPKFAGQTVRQRASSPKLQALNLALVTAQSQVNLETMLGERDAWGRLAESAIGAHILNSAVGTDIETFYWREGNLEVDFVLRLGDKIIAIEVKSGRQPDSLPGLAAFAKAFAPWRTMLVGGQGVAIAEFLAMPVAKYFE